MTPVIKNDLLAAHNLERLEEIKRLSSAEGTISQVFIENMYYLPAESPGADFVANQVE